MKEKINLYCFIIFLFSLNVIISYSAKNVLLLSNTATSKEKNCFFKKLIKSFKLKKLEKEIPALENIYVGKIGQSPVSFFNLNKFTEDQKENSKNVREAFYIMNRHNITSIDSILLFYALNDKNHNKIENDIETLISTFGEKITKTIMIVAINQRRILNVKRTHLDSLADRYNINFIHIKNECEDDLDREMIIHDFNFLYKQTVNFDIREYINSLNAENVSIKKTPFNLIFWVFVISVPILVLCLIKLCKLLNIKDLKVNMIRQVRGKRKEAEKETPLSCHELRKQMCSVHENLQPDHFDNEDNFENPKIDLPYKKQVDSNLIEKEEIEKEIEGILNNLEAELLEREEDEIKPFEKNLIERVENVEAVNDIQGIVKEEVESINPSDSDDAIKIDENEINFKTVSICPQIENLGTKNDWELLN